VRIPSTLLSLYLQSDLIILADYKDERITKRENENENGFYASLERDLNINKVFKGNAGLKTVSYATYEYKQKLKPGDTSNNDGLILFRNYPNVTPITIGNQYLFFLTKIDNEKFYLTDDLAGVKDVSENLSIYEKNLEELKAIVENKENQLASLTEWLVKNLEEPITRWDSIQDIYTSSNVFAYEKNNSKNENQQPFVLDKNFRTYTSAIAKSLTDSQKERISALLTDATQRSWFGQKPETIDYRLIKIVSSWEKSQLVTNAFSILQSIDESEFDRRKLIMEFISNAIEDGKLRNSYYQYSDVQIGKTKEIQAKNLLIRNKQFEDFNDRFQFLLIRNFEPVADE
jgi:hypothetical protein